MGFIERLTDRVEGFLDDVFIPDDLRRQLERGSRLIERGKHDQALDLLRRAASQYSDHHRTYHLIGLCQFFRGDYAASLEALQRALELREEPASLLYAGLAAEQLDSPAEAKHYFQTALGAAESPPFEFDLYFGLGRVLLQMERAEKAVHELRKARRLAADDQEVAVALGRALLESGQIDEARALLEEIPAGSLGGDGLLLGARLAEKSGEPGRAAALFEQLLEDEPGDVAAMLGAARTHLHSGAPAKSQQYLLQVLERAEADRQRLQAHNLLGRAKQKAGEWEQALEQYRSALALAGEFDAPDEAVTRAHLGAGRALMKLEEVDEAAGHFEEIVAAPQPSLRVEGRLQLARCRLEQGNPSEARRLVEDLDRREIPDSVRAQVRRVSGLASLSSGDPAAAIVAFQDALHLTDKTSLSRQLEEDRREALEQLKPDWSLPGEVDGALQVEQTLEETLDFVRSAPHLEAYLDPLQRLAESMSTPLSVGILGEFNAGKSTLVNALIGEEVVPMGILPTTAHTCFIRYGPRKTARVVYREQAERDPQEERTVEVNFQEARRRMDQETDQIAHLEFLYPHPQLRSITFRDTPGFNALDDEHDEIASETLEEAEAILWVFDAKQTLSRTELDRLQQIEDSAERLIVLVNKIDEVDDEQYDAIESRLEETIGASVAGIFGISALGALEAATGAPGEESAEKTAAEGGFEQFREFLDSRFIQRAGRIKTLEARRRLGALVGEMAAEVEALLGEYDDLMGIVDELSQWLEQLQSERPAERAEREARSVDDQFDFAVTAVTREIREDLRPQGSIFSQALVLDDEDRAFALGALEKRLDDVLGRSRERVENEVGQLEEALTARLSDVLHALSVPNARSLNRRLEGLYDEIRVMRLLLAERVYGQIRERIHGRIEAAGPDRLERLEAQAPEEAEQWQEVLGGLLPEAARHVEQRLNDWYVEFFLAAMRFSDRVHHDLQLLRLEAEYRYDTTELRDLLT